MVAYKSLKQTGGKFQFSNFKSGCGHLRERPHDKTENLGTVSTSRVVPYKALEKFSKALYGTPERYLQCTRFPSCHGRELFITKFKSQFKWGFANVVVSRAGRLQEWSQGELRLYFERNNKLPH